ncbi:TMEM175 family protein [Leifsonia kafniensis]|uniref:TMEM175 family protein n=1 Tax=Leifsonia kafniensis TaxID=475957 RepID=A0ABP7KVD4_9MICO
MPTTRGLDRVVFFTDAVTAIAITLLILPLVDSVAQSAQQGLSIDQFLRDNGDGLAAFALSFAVIARLWMTHHAMFEHVTSYTRRLLVLNLLWAFTVVLLPLPTEIISQFPTTATSIAFYIGTMAVSSLLLTSMTLLVRGHPQLELDTNPIDDRKVFASIVATTLFFVALLIGVLVPAINFFALLILLLGWPLQALYDRRADARGARREGPPSNTGSRSDPKP